MVLGHKEFKEQKIHGLEIETKIDCIKDFGFGPIEFLEIFPFLERSATIAAGLFEQKYLQNYQLKKLKFQHTV